MNKEIVKGKIASTTSSVSGITSVLGGYNICHNICMTVIALLAVIGITIKGMPLEFLQTISVPLWIIGTLLLIITIIFYIKKNCISKDLLMANTGIIIAAIPFQELAQFQLFFMIFGFGLLAVAIINFILKRREKND